MPSETDRILCCVAMWVLAGFVWLVPEQAHSMDKHRADAAHSSLEKAMEAMRSGKTDQAFQMVNTVINNSPDVADAYLALGKAYEAQGDGANARQAYQVYIEKLNSQLPKDPEILLRLRRYGLY